MTDKELLTQFDAMCKEWFGKYGYSEIKSLNDINVSRLFFCIDRVGFANWDNFYPDDEEIEEEGLIHQISLYSNFDGTKDALFIELHNNNLQNNKKLLICVFRIVSKYFDVKYIDKNSEYTYEFHIKGITKS